MKRKLIIEECIVSGDLETISPTVRCGFLKDWSLLVLNTPQQKQHIHYYWEKNRQLRAVLTDEQTRVHVPFEENFHNLRLRLLGL